MEPPYVSMHDSKIPRASSLRLWKTLTLIIGFVAVVVTATFVWYAVTHKTSDYGEGEQTNDKHSQDGAVACPQLPTLFPLPKPLPDRITEVFDKISSVLSSLVDKEASLPAISMNIFYKDDILWSAHFGSKVYKQRHESPDKDTAYRIGSVTKIFAVLLVFKLFEEGKICSLDDPLNKYAPGFDIKNPFTNEDITLREITSQMSGLPREAPCLYNCSTTSAEQLALLRNRTLVLPPWTMPSYSNLGYALLGRLLTENLLNQTFEDWTKDNILKPLGMFNTGFKITTAVERNMAFPYLPRGKKMTFMDVGWLAPAGQMYSTINDMAKLGMMFAQPSEQKLFKPATLREMMTPKDVTPDGVTMWGSPFEMTFTQNVLVRGKGGNIDSYAASFSVIPELALGANLLISTTYYIQTSAVPRSVFLYDLLVPSLNQTLFELRLKSRFPIDPTPYTGDFVMRQGNPITGATITFTARIKPYQNVLRLEYPPQPTLNFEIKYIGERLVFQASRRAPGMTCMIERIGILAGVYFEAAESDGLSPGFKIPEWLLTAKRAQEKGPTRFEGTFETFKPFLKIESAI